MEYLVTFDDGSSAFLSHHGTKGMKWGVWNPETAARYAAKAPQGGGGGGIPEDEEDEDQNKRDITVGNTPNLSNFYDQEAFDKGMEYTKQEWNEFVDDMSMRFDRMGRQAQDIYDSGKQYTDGVVSAGTRFGTNTGNAANDVSKVVDDIVNLRINDVANDVGKAADSISTAAKSGSDYVDALFWEHRR